jgi:hypothetical protein
MPSSTRQITGCLAVMVMALGIPAVWLGVIGLMYEAGGMQAVFGGVLLSGLMMVAAAGFDLLRHRREVRREVRHRAEILAAVPRLPATAVPGSAEGHAASAARPARLPVLPSGEPVLAHWTYGADQWWQHADRASARGCADALVPGLGMFLVSLYMGRNDRLVVPVSLGLALLVVAGGLYARRRTYGARESGPAQVIITPTALVLNGEYHTLRGGPFQLQRVSYSPSAGALEFSIAIRRAYDPANVRVPVPPGREAEAKALADRMTRAVYDEARVPRRK